MTWVLISSAMDFVEREDMLFGFSSQETVDQVDNGSESEDSMLADGADSDVDLWNYQEDVDLNLASTDSDQDEGMLDFFDSGMPDSQDTNFAQGLETAVKNR
jgi:hypothetical protein